MGVTTSTKKKRTPEDNESKPQKHPRACATPSPKLPTMRREGRSENKGGQHAKIKKAKERGRGAQPAFLASL